MWYLIVGTVMCAKSAKDYMITLGKWEADRFNTTIHCSLWGYYMGSQYSSFTCGGHRPAREAFSTQITLFFNGVASISALQELITHFFVIT